MRRLKEAIWQVQLFSKPESNSKALLISASGQIFVESSAAPLNGAEEILEETDEREDWGKISF